MPNAVKSILTAIEKEVNYKALRDKKILLNGTDADVRASIRVFWALGIRKRTYTKLFNNNLLNLGLQLYLSTYSIGPKSIK